MKKKLILFITLVLTIIPSVKAAGYEADMSSWRKGNGNINSASEACGLSKIYNSFYDGNGHRLSAVRITVVDQTGKRVPGTISADFSSTSVLFTKQWQKTVGNLKYGPMKAGYGVSFKENATIYRSYENGLLSKMEYEYRSIEESWQANETIGVWYWPNLPNYSSGESSLLNYFKSNFIQDAMSVFSILQYNDYNDPDKYKNHYLLVEPISIFFLRFPNSNCTTWDDFRTEAYYGTSTELTLLVNRNETTFANSADGIAMRKQWARDLYTTAERAGLKAGSDVISSDPNSYSVTEYGVGAGHVWISDVMTGGKYCIRKLTGEKFEYTTAEEKQRLCPPTCMYKGNEFEYRTEKERQEKCPGGGGGNKKYCPVPYDKIEIPEGYTQEQVCGCQYSVDISKSNDCTTGTSGTIKDTYTRFNDYDENCLYDAIGKPVGTFEGEIYAPNGDTTFSGLSNSNPYCTVACKESVTYYFPSTVSVKAGSNFYIGTSGSYTPELNPVRIIGTTTCKTGYMPTGNGSHSNEIGINLDQFRKDYASANTLVKQKWDEVLKAQAAVKALANAVNDTNPKSEKKEHSCSVTYNVSGTCVGDGNYNIRFNNPSGVECNSRGTNCRVTGMNGWQTHSTNDPNACTSYRDSCNGDSNPNKVAACRNAFQCEVTACTRDSTETYTNDQCPAGGFPHDGERYYNHMTYTGTYTVKLTSGTSYKATESYTVHVDKDGSKYDNTYSSKKKTLDSAVESAMSTYYAAVSARNKVVESLRSCTNFYRTYKEFAPGLDFVYSDSFYKNNYSLSGTSQLSASITTNKNGSKNFSTNINSTKTFETVNGDVGDTATIAKWNCGTKLTGCTSGTETYPTSTTAESITQKIYDYTLPDNIYRYVAKNGRSYNSLEEAVLSDYPYVDIGRSNLPIYYATPKGNYDYYLEYYYSSGTSNLFGTNQKYLIYKKVEPGGQETYNGLVMSKNLKYHCTYNVTTDIQEDCPNGNCDINIIYRPIDLNNPFPGINGTGREHGSNWTGLAERGGLYYDYTYAYIENNRGVKTNEVYNLKPMYEFFLNSSNIRNIRKYNKNQKNNYNDFNLECTNGFGCTSNFLKNGIKDGYFSFTRKNSDGGTCYGVTYDQWESCRYTNIGG